MPQQQNYHKTDMGWGSDYGPWLFKLLSEPSLTTELTRLSAATSFHNVDSVSFQPCPNPRYSSQDRHIVSEWPLPNGTWKFIGVFDGHAGHETVDYVVDALPLLIKSSLSSVLGRNVPFSPALISDVLSQTIRDFDESMARGLLDLFPQGPEAMAKLSDDDIRAVINDTESGGINTAKALHCMRGSTALVSLIDPDQVNVYVASLGDCVAVLGGKNYSGEWFTTLLSSNHNGVNKSESDRIRKEHPGEPECIIRNRVLGAISVTRALGDHLFKLPAIYTERIFSLAGPGLRLSTKVEDFLHRNKTPPYLSNRPDVRHINLNSLNVSEPFLIMCSDGLIELYEGESFNNDLQKMAQTWVQIVGSAKTNGGRENGALRLLRDGVGGEDAVVVSRNMTVEMSDKWMDDTTIVVCWL